MTRMSSMSPSSLPSPRIGWPPSRRIPGRIRSESPALRDIVRSGLSEVREAPPRLGDRRFPPQHRLAKPSSSCFARECDIIQLTNRSESLEDVKSVDAAPIPRSDVAIRIRLMPGRCVAGSAQAGSQCGLDRNSTVDFGRPGVARRAV